MVLIIKIFKNVNKNCTIDIAQLGINWDVTVPLATETLCKLFIDILGFSHCKLSGLNVKDKEGRKIKPIIDIYVKKNILFRLPREFKFTKDKFNGPKPMNIQKCIFKSSSLILPHLLDNTSINFADDDKKQYLIEKTNNNYVLCLYDPKPLSIMDSIFGFSAHSEITKIIDSYNTPFTNLLRIIISAPGKNTEIKNFYKKIKKNLKDVEYAYLCDVVTHSPTFFDSRDKFMDELEKFLNADRAFEDLGKTDYLEIKEMKIIKKGVNIGIKKLIE